MSHIVLPKHKPWFLRNKLKHGSIGEWSHLTREDFFELLTSVEEEAARLHIKHRHLKWNHVKEAALRALAHVAERHHCAWKLNDEGGDICFYYHGEPVFALSVGGYVKPTVRSLARSGAFYRGIIDVRNRFADFLPSITTKDGYLVLDAAKTFYHMMPVRGTSKWRTREASDMLCIIDCIREDSQQVNLTSRDITSLVKMNRHKVLKLLSWLEKRGVIYRKGRSVSTGWYLNRSLKWESKSSSNSSSDSDEK